MAEKNTTKGNTTDGPAEATVRPYTDELVIEVGDERNRMIMWPPTKEILRGRYIMSQLLPTEMVETMVGMPDIPGMQIMISGRRRRLTIFDPLSLPENQGLFESLKNHLKRYHNKDVMVSAATIRDDVSDSDLKAWLWFAHRLVLGSPREIRNSRFRSGGPKAIIIAGKMPAFDEIVALPGQVRTNLFEAGRERRYLETHLTRDANS